jgi:hypothetical protein
LFYAWNHKLTSKCWSGGGVEEVFKHSNELAPICKKG